MALYKFRIIIIIISPTDRSRLWRTRFYTLRSTSQIKSHSL